MAADAHPYTIFEQLVGEQLSAVTFVQDYLQLHFDGPAINVTAPLTVRTAATTIGSAQLGFRDALCAQIANIVAHIVGERGVHLTIVFDDGSAIEVHTGMADAEAYYAHGFAGQEFAAE